MGVTVHAAEVLEWAAPDLTFRVTVSAGTYVRAIARDLGERLGVGGHLTALRRETIGALDVRKAVAPDAVTAAAVAPARDVLAHLPAVEADGAAREHLRHGRPVPDAAGHAGLVALVAGDDLVAVASAGDGWLRPTVVLEGA